MSLLFIIFGRKVREKDYGPAYPLHCPGCDNDVYYHAYKWRSWFHIFWIPLIPWFSHGEIVCPICQSRWELEGETFTRAKELVETTQQYRERQLTDREYAKAVHDFEVTASFVAEPTDIEPPHGVETQREVEERDIEQPPPE